MVSFCTVQESTFFGADFRIGKSTDARNDGQRRVACIGLTIARTPLAQRVSRSSLRMSR